MAGKRKAPLKQPLGYKVKVVVERVKEMEGYPTVEEIYRRAAELRAKRAPSKERVKHVEIQVASTRDFPGGFEGDPTW